VEANNKAEPGIPQCGSRYNLQEFPVKIKTIVNEPDKANPSFGVSIVAWSFDSKLLATCEGSMPNCLWIWDMETMELESLLIQYNSIKSAAWSPNSLLLALCTGTGQVFFWSKQGALVCTLSLEAKDFSTQKLQWAPNGKSLVIVDRARLTVGYPEFADQESASALMHEDKLEEDN